MKTIPTISTAFRIGSGVKIAVHLCAVAMVIGSVLGAGTARAARSVPVIMAPEGIVIDGWTGSVLYAKNADVPRYPASTVKIMTALVVFQHHIPLHRIVTVGPHAASYPGSTAGLWAGERITVWNLLHGMLMPSGNDAAIALADAVAGSDASFVRLMNAEATSLHLWHTHYLTPNGFDVWGQVTTARDLASLARVAMHIQTFARIVRTRWWTVHGASGQVLHQWGNLNKLLTTSPDVNGVKTGTTPGAGACLVSSAKENGKWVIAVNMGSTESSRFKDGASLLNYGLSVDAAPPGAISYNLLPPRLDTIGRVLSRPSRHNNET